MTLKTQFNVYAQVSTVDELRQRAAAVGMPVSELCDLLWRFGLAKLSPEKLAAYAATRKREPTALRKAERLVMRALEQLTRGVVYKHGLEEVAAQAGMRITEAFWALQGLRQREIVDGAELSKGVDRWGRPLESVWWLKRLTGQ